MTVRNPRANELFLDAVQVHGADESRELLDEACAGDEALRTEVEFLGDLDVARREDLRARVAPAAIAEDAALFGRAAHTGRDKAAAVMGCLLKEIGRR